MNGLESCKKLPRSRMTKRTTELLTGEPVEVEIDDPPATPLDEMVQMLLLAKHIYDNREKLEQTWLPPYKPVKRKKKANGRRA